MTYGDSFLPVDFAAVYAAFVRASKPALMTVYRNDGRWDSSNVIYEDGAIVLYDKHHRVRPAADFPFIDYGLMAFARRTVADEIPAAGKADLADCCTRSAVAASWRGWRSVSASTRSARRRGWRTSRNGCALDADRPRPRRRAQRLAPQSGRATSRQPDAPVGGDGVSVGAGRHPRSDAGRVRHRHRQQPAGVGEGQDDARRAAGGARRRRRGRPVGGRHHPELAHLLSPRRGQVHMPQARDRPAGRGVRAAPGVRPSPRRGWRATARPTSSRARRSG